MSISSEQVLKALSQVIEPDLKRDLVTLNMISDLKVEGLNVSFSVILTTPACPLKDSIKNACIRAIHELVSPQALVTVTMTSKVTPSQKAGKSFNGKVKNIIAVASGKGGVGKSTVTANLAVAMAAKGARVGLIDADIYGPSMPIMFNAENDTPVTIEKDGRNLVLPVEKHGVHLLSIGFFVDPQKALVWRGPMAANALTQLFNDADWGELDYLFVDMPPGTGDIHLTLSQSVAVSGVVIVTTPQKVALADARKAISMFNNDKIQIPVLGLVENMAWFTPAELPENRYYIFGRDGGKLLAEECGVPLLAQIPLVQDICESADKGSPSVLNLNRPEAKAFEMLAENLARQVSITNASLKQTIDN